MNLLTRLLLLSFILALWPLTGCGQTEPEGTVLPFQSIERNDWGGFRGDREKPEIVAVGQSVTTIEKGGDVTIVPPSGTSNAAPQVSGLAALMMEKNSDLIEWPAAVKAAMMASAAHDIEPPGIMRQDSLDDKDGAGVIVGSLAVELADIRAAVGDTCYRPCWWAEEIDNISFPEKTYRYYTLWAETGDKVRVAISWHSNAWGPPGYEFNTLDTNLNLLVHDPDRQPLVDQGGYSASWDNNYEIVEFEAPQTGAYQISVYNHSMIESSNRLGIAWTRVKRYDAAYLSPGAPGLALPDRDYRVCFTIRNDGYLEWPGGGGRPVRLGSHWSGSPNPKSKI